MILRKIPSTNESLPVIGLGTWQSFDKSPSSNLDPLKQVLVNMGNAGGKVIDSSPMYGKSEEIVGLLTEKADAGQYFYATKVWTRGKDEGVTQMESSFKKFRREVIDLVQVHNLVDWKMHLQTLRKWKDEGRIRYIGVTHYTSSMHDELITVLKSEPVDFVQFNYSITDRNAEKTLLPAASDLGVATLINRPFGEGSLFNTVRNKNLPQWAKEYGMETWSQFVLKYIISHPAVTCVIPATSDPSHAEENYHAGVDPLPDESIRKKMVEYIKQL